MGGLIIGAIGAILVGILLSGSDDDSDKLSYKQCSTCSGKGKVDCSWCNGWGTVFGETCRWCSSGKVDCSNCGGRGKIKLQVDG